MPQASCDTPSRLPQSIRRARLLSWQDVDLVVDVGANVGQYATGLRRSGYSGPIVSFEPLATAYSALAASAADDPLWSCNNLALGGRAERAELNVASDSACSSFLRLASRTADFDAGLRYVETESVQIERLDAIWSDIVDKARRPYVKIDVQGYEMEVLAGAAAILGDVRAVELELSLIEAYDRMPLANEMIATLASEGLRLAAVECICDEPSTGEMLQLDAVFVRA